MESPPSVFFRMHWDHEPETRKPFRIKASVFRFMGSLLSSARMHWDLEPTPNPSQEGSRTAWPVPLLGGVRGGFVARRFMQSVRRSVQRVNRVRCAPSLFALHALLLSASSGALA